MATRAYVDFGYVEPAHADIDQRLQNWARWCIGGGGSDSSPMFSSFRSSHTLTPGVTRVPVDEFDARCIERAVCRLRPQLAATLRWAYVHPCSPKAAARDLGCDLATLHLWLIEGRQALRYVNGAV